MDAISRILKSYGIRYDTPTYEELIQRPFEGVETVEIDLEDYEE